MPAIARRASGRATPPDGSGSGARRSRGRPRDVGDDHLAVQHERASAPPRPQRLRRARGSIGSAASGRGTEVDIVRHGRRGRGSRPTSARRSSRRRPGSRGRLGQHRLDRRLDRECHAPMIRPPAATIRHTPASGRAGSAGERLVSISIQFLGAAGCVTGSQFLVSVGDRRAGGLRHVPGLAPGGRAQLHPVRVRARRLTRCSDARPPRPLRPDPGPDACRLPRADPRHLATVDLAEVVLLDSAKLQAEFTNRWNRRQARRAERAEQADAETQSEAAVQDHDLAPNGRAADRPRARPRSASLSTTSTTWRGQWSSCAGATTATRSASRTASRPSSTTPATSSGRRSSRCASPMARIPRSIVFSGDLGRNGSPILRDPTPLTHAEYIVVESTYGNREHAPHDAAIVELRGRVDDVATTAA